MDWSGLEWTARKVEMPKERRKEGGSVSGLGKTISVGNDNTRVEIQHCMSFNPASIAIEATERAVGKGTSAAAAHAD